MKMFSIECWSEGDAGEDGSYELVGGTATRPCGSASEWKALAESIKSRKAIGFKRLAMWIEGDWAMLSCPRNCYGPRDHEIMPMYEAQEFADEILNALHIAGEPCMFEAFDPVAMGM